MFGPMIFSKTTFILCDCGTLNCFATPKGGDDLLLVTRR
jgi:hypothetical protein